MRTVGAAVAGMFAGLLLGLALTEPDAGPPLLALAGAGAGVLVERRTR